MDPREIDAAVAEKIFGQGKHLTRHGDGEVCQLVPHYSTDIAAAWQVVEKMSPPSNVFSFFDLIYSRERWIADFGIRVEADTAPMAICLAALKAVGVEVKE